MNGKRRQKLPLATRVRMGAGPQKERPTSRFRIGCPPMYWASLPGIAQDFRCQFARRLWSGKVMPSRKLCRSILSSWAASSMMLMSLKSLASPRGTIPTALPKIAVIQHHYDIVRFCFVGDSAPCDIHDLSLCASTFLVLVPLSIV